MQLLCESNERGTLVHCGKTGGVRNPRWSCLRRWMCVDYSLVLLQAATRIFVDSPSCHKKHSAPPPSPPVSPVSPRLPRESSWLSDLLKSTGGLCWVSSLAVKGRLILHSCRPCFSSTQYHHAVRRRPLARLEKRLQSLIQQSRNRQVAQPTHKQTMSRLSIRGFVWV